MYLHNNRYRNERVRKYYIQLKLKDEKVIGVCGLNDARYQSLKASENISVELSEYAERQLDEYDICKFDEALVFVTEISHIKYFKIYKFRGSTALDVSFKPLDFTWRY